MTVGGWDVRTNWTDLNVFQAKYMTIGVCVIDNWLGPICYQA
jgi:hypothetical protein